MRVHTCRNEMPFVELQVEVHGSFDHIRRTTDPPIGHTHKTAS